MSEQVISVVVPVNQPGPYFVEAILSVVDQALPPHVALELVVVFDGPDSSAEAKLKELYPSAVIKIHEERKGPSAARNTGIRCASGKWISFIDADDVWVPNRIVRDFEILCSGSDSPSPHAILSQHQAIEKNSGGEWIRQRPGWVFLTGIGTYRREVFDEVGYFDESLTFGEDSDWFFRFWEAGIPFQVRWEVGLLYRIHEGSLTWGRTLREKGHLKALKRSLDRRREGSGRARLFYNPDESLRLSDSTWDPNRGASLMRSCLREKWRYYEGLLPITLICSTSNRDSMSAKHCRQIIELPDEGDVSWRQLIEQVEEPFVAIEMSDSVGHPARMLEQFGTFELYPHIDVALSSHLVLTGKEWVEKGNPDLSSFLARTSLMKNIAWNLPVTHPSERVMFTLYCEWKKKEANIQVLLWALTAQTRN